jgi:hypothetical protein
MRADDSAARPPTKFSRLADDAIMEVALKKSPVEGVKLLEMEGRNIEPSYKNCLKCPTDKKTGL